MASFGARLMPALVTLLGVKRNFEHPLKVYKLIHDRQLRPEPYAPPKALDRAVRISVRYVDGWPVYEVVPKNVTAVHRVLYLHGGAYIAEIMPAHWRYIAEIVRSTAARVTVPIYPLAPLGTAERVVPAAADLAAELVADAGADLTTIMGDSAGGGMALAVLLQLRDRGIAAPRGILISPWLDVAMTAPAIAAVEAHDPMLAPPGLAAAGDAYRAELAADDPRVSPLFGDLRGLGRITLFCGTRDILVVDARRLAERALEAGMTLDYYEAPGMLHVYPLMPISEAREARALIAGALGRR